MALPKLRPVIGAALLALLGMTPLAAQTAPKILQSGVERPESAIFIGNSFFYYNNSLHNHVLRLVSAADPAYRLRATSVTISGSGLDWHDMASYLQPDGKLRELTPVEVADLRTRYDGTRGSAARIAAAWGITRYQVHRALKRYGVEEAALEEIDDAPEKLLAR